MTARENIVSNAFDALVIRLAESASMGHDIFQDATAAALDIVDMDTHMRFVLGDLTTLIEASYGMDRMGEWASSIKKSRKTCYGYAAVSRFFPMNDRAGWLNEPALSWSHMRLAMRLKNADDASEFLSHCADNALSVDKASVEMKERLGETITPPALFNGAVTFERVNGRLIANGLEYTAIQEGVSYSVKIVGMA